MNSLKTLLKFGIAPAKADYLTYFINLRDPVDFSKVHVLSAKCTLASKSEVSIRPFIILDILVKLLGRIITCKYTKQLVKDKV